MKSYLITDPHWYGSDPESFDSFLDTILSSGKVDYALYRDKTTSDYPETAAIFIRRCRMHRIEKALLHSDPELARILGADGVHLTSAQLGTIEHAKSLGLYVIISTHTHDEAKRAEELGADAVTYSPVFPSPGKGEPKGLEDLKEIVAKINIPIFALGGIVSDEQIKAVEQCGAYGFASIRYFVP